MELGQYHAARQMVEQSIKICDAALQHASHPGYSRWLVRDTLSHQYNVLATIEREQPAHDFGIALSKRVRDIRIENCCPSGAGDDMWIAAAEANLALSLMAKGRAEEAYEILQRLGQRDDMKANEDICMRNTCLCLFILGRLDEALAVNRNALNAASRKRGESSEQVAA